MDLRYGVIYKSKTGNTKKLAEWIFDAIEAKEKSLINLDEKKVIPEADFYFIGFGIYNRACSLEIIDIIEQLEGIPFAIFTTCGFMPTKKYKRILEKNLYPWFPEDCRYEGMLLCQGEVDELNRSIMKVKMPDMAEQLEEMFNQGLGHPDEDDKERAYEFVQRILER